MKKIFMAVAVMFLMASCTSECDFESGYQFTQDEYETMYEFVGDLYHSEMFEMSEPVNPSYEEMMTVCATIIRTDLFGDTFAEGDCEKVYRLMYAYFLQMQPDAEITNYLGYILEHGMY